jgi:hypothetical protein
MSYNREQVQLPAEASNPYGLEWTQCKSPLLLGAAAIGLASRAVAAYKVTTKAMKGWRARGSADIQAHLEATERLKKYRSERQALLSGLDDFFSRARKHRRRTDSDNGLIHFYEYA